LNVVVYNLDVVGSWCSSNIDPFSLDMILMESTVRIFI
jgi:hypothetical protein